ncbi:cysteine desulfurase [Deinococcus cellulosilyticus]
MMTRSWQEVRADFPILRREVNGKRLVYLDSTATAQKPRCVIDALSHFYEHTNANIHRGAYSLSIESTDLYEQARSRIAALIHAPETGVVFTRNTTEAINLVARTWALDHLKSGDQILVTELEHHSNLVPWHIAAKATGAEVVGVRITSEGRLDQEDYQQKLRSGKVKLVAVGHISNALGTINPVKQMAVQAHEAGAVILVDGAQSVPHLPVNVQDLDADFYAFSGHKMCGPTGAGVLYGRPELLEKMSPFLGGGEMIDQVFVEHSTYADLPRKFEAGTPAIAEVIALGVAAQYLQDIGLERIWQHEQELMRYALERIRDVPELTQYGPIGEDRAGVLSFNLEGVHSHDVAGFLDEQGICVRSGHHCAQPLMRALGVGSTARASFYLYNTREDIDLFIEAMQNIALFFKE